MEVAKAIFANVILAVLRGCSGYFEGFVRIFIRSDSYCAGLLAQTRGI